MLFLIVVTSVFGIGLCNRVYQEPSSRFPYYLALAKTQLPGLKPSQGAAVKWVTITVGRLCQILFLEHNHGQRSVKDNTCVHVSVVGKRQLGGMPEHMNEV